MKKNFSILTFLLLFCSAASSQWVRQLTSVPDIWTSIHFINPNTGFCTGSSNLLKTTNGGTNWETNVTPGTGLRYVKMFSENNIVVASIPAHTVYRSTNGGNNWNYSVIPIGGTGVSVQFTSFTNGYFLAGIYLYKTTDAGYNWVEINVSCGSEYMSFVNDDIGWISGNTVVPPSTWVDVIEKTTNGGLSWNGQFSIPYTSYNIGGVFFNNTNNGFVNRTISPCLMHTTNGGQNWAAPISGVTALYTYNAMSFPDNNTGWLVGGSIIKTTDGGFNWETKSTPFGNYFNNVFFINDTVGWLVGLDLILKTTNGGITGFTNPGNRIPDKYSLDQNYPNPFNPVTNIKYEILKTSQVKLVIFDALGREIAVLVNEQLKPGSYEVNWDASNYTSGVYFYKLVVSGAEPLTAGDYTETKKMILLK